MRRSLAVLLVFLVAFMVTPVDLQGQTALPTDYNGQYVPLELVAAGDSVEADDTLSTVVFCPSWITSIDVYVLADSVSASDSLNVLIYGSPVNSEWDDTGVWSTAALASSGNLGAEAVTKFSLTSPPPYLTFRRDVTGSSVDIRARVFIVAHSSVKP